MLLLDTGEGLLGRKKEHSISEGVTDQKDGDTSVTDHRVTTETTEQGPPTAPVNTLFPADQPIGGGVHESAANKEVEGMSEAMTGAVRQMSEVPMEASEVFDPAFSVTDHRVTTETTKQGPPTARVNTLFPADQPIEGGVHESAADKEVEGMSEAMTGAVRRMSEVPMEASEVFDPAFSVTDHRVTTETTKQGPPTARVNTLFPADQPIEGGVHESAADKEVEGMSEAMTGAVRRMSEVPMEASEVFDPAFIKKSKWSTLYNFVHSLQPHKGGGCSHLVHEVKNIAEDCGGIPSEDQVKEQIKVMAQHAIDSE